MSAALADVGCASAFEACLPAISAQMKESIGLAKLKVRAPFGGHCFMCA